MRTLLRGHLALVLLFLWAPLTFVVLRGTSLEGFQRLWDHTQILEALGSSCLLALLAGTGATVFGTLIAFFLNTLSPLSRRLIQACLLFPMLLPEIAFGLSSMTWFIELGIPLGWLTLGWSHIAFSVSYSTFIMKSQVESVNPSLLEAASDLGANQWGVFRHALWPQLLPGCLASFVTAFALSFDDFLITFFVKGIDQVTLPIQIYGMMKVHIGPEIYSLSFLLLCISWTTVLFSQLWLSGRSSKLSSTT